MGPGLLLLNDVYRSFKLEATSLSYIGSAAHFCLSVHFMDVIISLLLLMSLVTEPCYLVAATSLAVDAGILTCHNLHIIASDGDTGGTIVTREAAKIAVHEFKMAIEFSSFKNIKGNSKKI